MSPEGRRHGGEHEVIPGPPASVTRRTGLGSLRRASRRIGNLETSPSVALSSGNQGSWCGWVRRYPGKGLSVLTPPSFTSMIRTDRTLSDVGLGRYPQANKIDGILGGAAESSPKIWIWSILGDRGRSEREAGAYRQIASHPRMRLPILHPSKIPKEAAGLETSPHQVEETAALCSCTPQSRSATHQ
ncbi:hypothetical protein VUR80DRAFT_5979 [Thermomyces stellatus]